VTDLLARIRGDIKERMAELEPIVREATHLESVLAELDEERSQLNGVALVEPGPTLRFVRRGHIAD
jgi:hypothetical protein